MLTLESFKKYVTGNIHLYIKKVDETLLSSQLVEEIIEKKSFYEVYKDTKNIDLMMDIIAYQVDNYFNEYVNINKVNYESEDGDLLDGKVKIKGKKRKVDKATFMNSVFIKFVNKEHYKNNFISQSISFPFLDIVGVYYFLKPNDIKAINNNEDVEGDIIEMILSPSVLNTYNITVEELHAAALKNTLKNDFTMQKVSDYIEDSLLDFPLALDLELDDIGDTMLDCYTVTSEVYYNGSSILLDGEALEDIANVIGDNYYIIPIDRHEILAIGEKSNKDINTLARSLSLLDMLTDTLDDVDTLSNSVYYYNNDEKTLEIF